MGGWQAQAGGVLRRRRDPPSVRQRRHASGNSAVAEGAVPELAVAPVAPRPEDAVVCDAQRVVRPAADLDRAALRDMLDEAGRGLVPHATVPEFAEGARPPREYQPVAGEDDTVLPAARHVEDLDALQALDQ